MEIKQYLHYYIGQQMIFEKSGRIITLSGTYPNGILSSDTGIWDYNVWNFKLILRRLEDITEEDARELALIYCKEYPHQLYAKPQLNEAKRNTTYRGGGFCAAIYNDAEFTNYESLVAIHFAMLNAEQFNCLIKAGYWLFDPEAFDNNLIIDKKTLVV